MKEQFINFFKNENNFLLIEAESGSGKTTKLPLLIKAYIEVFGDVADTEVYEEKRYIITYTEGSRFEYSSTYNDPADTNSYYEENLNPPLPLVYIDCLEELSKTNINRFKNSFTFPNEDYPYKLVIAASKEAIKAFELNYMNPIKMKYDYPDEYEVANILNGLKIKNIGLDTYNKLKESCHGKSYTYAVLMKKLIEDEYPFKEDEIAKLTEEDLMLYELSLDKKAHIFKTFPELLYLANGYIFDESFDDLGIKLIDHEFASYSSGALFGFIKRHPEIFTYDEVTGSIWFNHYSLTKKLGMASLHLAGKVLTALCGVEYDVINNQDLIALRNKCIFLSPFENTISSYLFNLSDYALGRIKDEDRLIRLNEDDFDYDYFKSNLLDDSLVDAIYFLEKLKGMNNLCTLLGNIIDKADKNELYYKRFLDLFINDLFKTFYNLGYEKEAIELLTKMFVVTHKSSFFTEEVNVVRKYNLDELKNVKKLLMFSIEYDVKSKIYFECDIVDMYKDICNKYEEELKKENSFKQDDQIFDIIDLTYALKQIKDVRAQEYIEKYFTFEDKNEFLGFMRKNKIIDKNKIFDIKVLKKID